VSISSLPPSSTLILPVRRSPFFSQTVSARVGSARAQRERQSRGRKNIEVRKSGQELLKGWHYPYASCSSNHRPPNGNRVHSPRDGLPSLGSVTCTSLRPCYRPAPMPRHAAPPFIW